VAEPDLAQAELPVAPAPQGQYVPAVVHGGVAVSAGMTPRVADQLTVVGIVDSDVSVREAFAAAGLAAANALSAIAQAAGGLPNVTRCLRLTVYIACGVGFTEHTAVADGASAELQRLLGDRGAAARSAVGVANLPSGSPVEVELMAAVKA
jgi:enamine deaminase RidA (YjgF/YER057c/UK114 family)